MASAVFVNDAQALHKATPGAAGRDLLSQDNVLVPAGKTATVSTPLRIDMPKDMCALVKGRSGLAAKHSLLVHNGVIDSDYTGLVKVIVHNMSSSDYTISAGDRIAQLLFVNIASPTIILKANMQNRETVRGEGCLGHTGK